MFRLCLITFSIPFLIAANDPKQCENGYFLKNDIMCEKCLDFCSNLFTITSEQKAYCSPFCSNTTPSTVVTTSRPAAFKVSSTSIVPVMPLPSGASVAIYAIIVIPVILFIIMIGLLIYYRENLHCRKSSPGSHVTRVYVKVDDIEGGPGVVILDVDETRKSLIEEDTRDKHNSRSGPHSIPFGPSEPAAREEGDIYIRGPELQSIPPQSMDPIKLSLSSNPISFDPKPIPRDFAIRRNDCPELVQSIMTNTRLNEAPSELLQEPKKKQNIQFNLDRNETNFIEDNSFTSEEKVSIPLEESLNSEQSDGGGPFKSILPTDSGSPSPDFGSGNSRTIMQPKYTSIDPEDDQTRRLIRRDQSCESTDACILPSIMPQDQQDDEFVNPFSDLPVAPPDSPSTPRTTSFFKVDKSE